MDERVTKEGFLSSPFSLALPMYSITRKRKGLLIKEILSFRDLKVNSLPDDIFLGKSKLKAFADDKINVNKK